MQPNDSILLVQGLSVAVSFLVAYGVAWLVVAVAEDVCTESGRNKLADCFSWFDGAFTVTLILLVVYGILSFETWATGNGHAFLWVFTAMFGYHGYHSLRSHGVTKRRIAAGIGGGIFGLLFTPLFSWLGASQPSTWAIGTAFILATALLVIRCIRQ